MGTLHIDKIPFAEINQDLRQEIDSFIERNLGTVYHETALNSISARFFGTELSFYLARRNGKMVGICPCHSIKQRWLVNTYTNLTTHDLVYGGWVYNSSFVTLDCLLSKTKLRWNEALHVASNIELDPSVPYKTTSSRRLTEAQTVIIKLTGSSQDEIFQGFKHSQKNKIRKAEKMGIQIRQIVPEQISEFYELLTDLKENLNKVVSPPDYFREVLNLYYSQGRGACFVASHEGQNISTLIILANKAYATIWFGGRKMGIPNNLYQNELMIWEAIKWASSFGSAYFDLCTVDANKHANLARIKLSFSKNIKPYYHFDYRNRLFKIINRLQKTIKYQ